MPFLAIGTRNSFLRKMLYHALVFVIKEEEY
jgi:hypothetical protein